MDGMFTLIQGWWEREKIILKHYQLSALNCVIQALQNEKTFYYDYSDILDKFFLLHIENKLHVHI